MFYEAMEDVLPDVKVVIESSEGKTNTILPLDSFVSGDTSDGAGEAGEDAGRNAGGISSDSSKEDGEASD